MSYTTADELDRLAADLLSLVPRIRAAAKALRKTSPAATRVAAKPAKKTAAKKPTKKVRRTLRKVAKKATRVATTANKARKGSASAKRKPAAKSR